MTVTRAAQSALRMLSTTHLLLVLVVLVTVVLLVGTLAALLAVSVASASADHQHSAEGCETQQT